MAIISENIAGLLIQVPDDLPAPATREAIAHAVKAKRAWSKAFAARDGAAELRFNIEARIALDHGALLDEDPEAVLPDGAAIVAEAQSTLEANQRELDARTEAERRAVVKVREAIASELPRLARLSLASGDTALAMLAAALEDAIAARDALHSSVGVGHMCARLELTPAAPIAIQHKAYGYTFDIEAAIEGLTESLRKAAAELDELRNGVKGTAPKKARKARNVASEAHGDAETVSFEIGEDDDA